MTTHTRISLRRPLMLVTYIAGVMFLVVPDVGQEPSSQPLSWVYHFGREAPSDAHAWQYVVVGIGLLVGTLPPFFLFRWWALLPAIICGALYILIGLEAATYKFTP